MRFLARDQVSNVLASPGHGTVLSTVLLRREKKTSIRASVRATRRTERVAFILSSKRRASVRTGPYQPFLSTISISVYSLC